MRRHQIAVTDRRYRRNRVIQRIDERPMFDRRKNNGSKKNKDPRYEKQDAQSWMRNIFDHILRFDCIIAQLRRLFLQRSERETLVNQIFYFLHLAEGFGINPSLFYGINRNLDVAQLDFQKLPGDI